MYSRGRYLRLIRVLRELDTARRTVRVSRRVSDSVAYRDTIKGSSENIQIALTSPRSLESRSRGV